MNVCCEHLTVLNNNDPNIVGCDMMDILGKLDMQDTETR